MQEAHFRKVIGQPSSVPNVEKRSAGCIYSSMHAFLYRFYESLSRRCSRMKDPRAVVRRVQGAWLLYACGQSRLRDGHVDSLSR